MEMKENVCSVLVVSSSGKFNSTIVKLLPDSQYYPISISLDASSAKRLLLEQSFDIIMINAPLRDEFGARFASELCHKTSSGILLLVRNEHFADISGRLAPFGILTVSKPAPAQVILETMLLLCGTSARLKRIEKKAVPFEEKMAQIRLINQAKLILISEKGMSEAAAHRYIEKTAMDRCITLAAVADEILRTHGSEVE